MTSTFKYNLYMADLVKKGAVLESSESASLIVTWEDWKFKTKNKTEGVNSRTILFDFNVPLCISDSVYLSSSSLKFQIS